MSQSEIEGKGDGFGVVNERCFLIEQPTSPLNGEEAGGGQEHVGKSHSSWEWEEAFPPSRHTWLYEIFLNADSQRWLSATFFDLVPQGR